MSLDEMTDGPATPAISPHDDELGRKAFAPRPVEGFERESIPLLRFKRADAQKPGAPERLAGRDKAAENVCGRDVGARMEVERLWVLGLRKPRLPTERNMTLATLVDLQPRAGVPAP